MIETFDKNTINRFSSILGYNIEIYMDLYSYFLQNNYPFIYRYFTEPDFQVDSNSFSFLDNMLAESVKIANILKIHKSVFNRVDDWELMDYIENIQIKLQTISQTSKYTRSPKSKNSWRTIGIAVEHYLESHETLEQVQYNNYGDVDFGNRWVNIAFENNLTEQDYGADINPKVTINKSIEFQKGFKIKSIVDNLVGTKLYGRDIYKKLTFLNNDILVLNYNDTVIQSISILIALKKGDVPEFPKFGIDANLGIGSNQNIFQYKQLIMQLTEVFLSDDSLVNFHVKNYVYENGDVFITYNVGTFYYLNYKNIKTNL